MDSKDMRELVRRGYDEGDYSGVFRSSSELTAFESTMIEAFLEHVPVGGSILDLGCGTGVPFDRYFVRNGRTVVGIDASGKHLSQARRNVPEARFIHGDFTSIPLEGSFDGIVSFYAIFHLPREEHAGIFARAHGALQAGGALLVTLGAQANESTDDDWCGAPMAWSSHDPATYRTLLHDAGFSIIREGFEGESGDQEHHFWVLAKKEDRTS